jgi:ribosomal protein S18 acetylase RimI-like enzyme
MKPESIEITRAGVDDESEIVPLMAAFNEAEGILWRPKTMVPALRHLLRDSGIGSVLLARDRASRAALGYGIVTFGYDIEFSGADAFVTELFVESASRRRGIGRALLDSLVLTLRDRGTRAVHLMVRPENRSARSLYESREFRLVPRLLMTKRLVVDED